MKWFLCEFSIQRQSETKRTDKVDKWLSSETSLMISSYRSDVISNPWWYKNPFDNDNSKHTYEDEEKILTN